MPHKFRNPRKSRGIIILTATRDGLLPLRREFRQAVASNLGEKYFAAHGRARFRVYDVRAINTIPAHGACVAYFSVRPTVELINAPPPHRVMQFNYHAGRASSVIYI